MKNLTKIFDENLKTKTVAALGREPTFVEKYSVQLDVPLQSSIKKSWIFGFMYGMSTGVIFLMYAGVFYFSAWLIQVFKETMIT